MTAFCSAGAAIGSHKVQWQQKKEPSLHGYEPDFLRFLKGDNLQLIQRPLLLNCFEFLVAQSIHTHLMQCHSPNRSTVDINHKIQDCLLMRKLDLGTPSDRNWPLWFHFQRVGLVRNPKVAVDPESKPSTVLHVDRPSRPKLDIKTWRTAALTHGLQEDDMLIFVEEDESMRDSYRCIHAVLVTRLATHIKDLKVRSFEGRYSKKSVEPITFLTENESLGEVLGRFRGNYPGLTLLAISLDPKTLSQKCSALSWLDHMSR